jgi:hypothetical protein
MKLFLIDRGKERLEQYRSFVVAARDEAEARRLAYEASFPPWWDEEDRQQFGEENMPEFGRIGDFLDPDKSTCSEIMLPDEPAVIHSQYTGS